MVQGVPGYLGPYRLLNVVHTGHACQLWQAYDDAKQRMVAVKTLLEKFYKDREQLSFLRWEYHRRAEDQASAHHRDVRLRLGPWPAVSWPWSGSPAPNMKQRILQGVEKIAPLMPKIIDASGRGPGLLQPRRLGPPRRQARQLPGVRRRRGETDRLRLGPAAAGAGWRSGLRPGPRSQGTKSYMSPEQIRGGALDERADLYSFACTIYELVSGKPPFTGISANELLTKHLEVDAPLIGGTKPQRHPGIRPVDPPVPGKKTRRPPQIGG